MNTELQQKAKNNFEKDFFKLMNNAIFRKTRENVKKIETLNLSQKKEEEIIYYQNQIIIQQNFPKKKNEKTQILMNKLVYLYLSTLDLSKTLMHEFW